MTLYEPYTERIGTPFRPLRSRALRCPRRPNPSLFLSSLTKTAERNNLTLSATLPPYSLELQEESFAPRAFATVSPYRWVFYLYF